MPLYRIQAPNGKTYQIEGPEGASDAQVAQAVIAQFPEANKPPSTERTWGEATGDIGASAVSGLGSLIQMPGQLYGLATGNFNDTGTLGLGKSIQKWGEEHKSEGLRAREAKRERKVAAAEQEGQLSAFGTSFKETIKDPALLMSFLAEQVPQLFVPGSAAMGAGRAAFTKAIAAGASETAAKAAAVAAGTAAAKGAGAVQQGADVGAQAYQDVYDRLIKQGKSKEEAAAQAIGLARATGASGAIISWLAQGLPGADALEKALAGGASKAGIARAFAAGAAGEGLSEMTEEGGGKFTQNLALREVDPTQSLLQGVGATMGQAAVGGVGMGGISGGISGIRGEERIAAPTPLTQPAGALTEQEQQREQAKLRRAQEQMSMEQGKIARAGEKLLAEEDAAAAKAAKAESKSVAEEIAAQEAAYRAQREEELRAAFPADYSDIMAGADAYANLAKEKAALSKERQTKDVEARIEQLSARMAEIQMADTRVADEIARTQAQQEKIAKKAGFPAQKSAKAMEEAPAQIEMREAMLAPGETLPQQLDLRGKPLEQAPDYAEPTTGDLLDGVPLTTENLRDAGLGPTRAEMKAAGQMDLFGRQRKATATPTETDRGLEEAVTTEEQPVTEPTKVEKAAPPTPETVPTVVSPDVLGALGIGRTAIIRRAEHGIMGKDIADPAQAAEVKSILEAYKEGRSAPIQEKINAYLARPEFQAAPAAPTSTGATSAGPTKQGGRRTRVQPSVQTDTGSTATTTPTSERAGVVPTGQDVGQAPAGKGKRKAPVNPFEQLMPRATKANPEVAEEITAEKEAAPAEEKPVPVHKRPWGGVELWKPEGRKSEPTEVKGQSLEELHAEINGNNSILGAALRRAINSGKVIIADKHPSGERFGGYYDGNRVFLYADGIPAGQALPVALHEIGVHLGAEKLLGKKQYDAVIERIKELAESKTASPGRELAQAAIKRIPKEDIARGADVTNDELFAYFVEEVAKAEEAGTLPKMGPLRAAWTQFKNAILGAINRAFGSKLGIDDLTAQDITAIAKGVLFVESYTKAVDFVENGTGYMGRFSKPGQLNDSTAVLLDNMIAETAPKERPTAATMVHAMAKGLVDSNERGYAAARTRQKLVDKWATIIYKTQNAYSKGIRSTTGEQSFETYVRQAEASDNLAAAFLHQGEIYIDPETDLLRVRQGDGSMMQVVKEVLAYKEDNNIKDGAKAKEQVSKFLENHRLYSMLQRNEELEQSAKRLESLGRTAAADKERAQKFRLHHNIADIRNLEAAFQANPRLKRISELLNQTKNSVIDMMVGTGRITRERGEVLKENSAYVPFDRVFDEEVINNIARGRGIAVFKNIPSMKQGSYDRPVHNVLDAYSTRLSSMVKDAANNRAVAKTLQVMDDLGLATKVDSPDAAKVKALVVTAYEKGEPTYYEVHDPLDFEAFKQQPDIMSSGVKFFRGLSRIFRATITAMPEFAVAQVVKDATYVYFNSGVQRPVVAAMKTLYNLPRVAFGEFTGKKLPVQKMMEDLGIVGNFDYNVLEPTKELEYEIGLEKRKFGIGGDIFHKLEQFTKASDLAARAAVFEETLLETGGVRRPDGMIEGGDMLLAQSRARELINFSRQGTSQTARVLSNTVAFFNAYAQGMDRTYRAMTGLDGSSSKGRGAARSLFWKRVAIMSTLATVYALAMSDDDDYRNASDELRDNNWVFPGGFKIPLPREYAFLFKAIPERVVAYLNRYGTPEEQQVSALLGSVMKAAMGAVASPAPIPPYIKPVVEHITNHSFFTGRELIPASQQALKPGEQHVTGTSEFSKLFGQKFNVSPILLDNYLKGFGGILAGDLLMVGDALINPTRPDRPLYQMPFAKIFLYDTVGGRDKTEFYDLRERTAQATTTLKTLEEKDPARAMEFYKENVGLLEIADAVNDAFKDLNDVRRMRVFIQDASDDVLGMDGKRRREMIDELRAYENQSVAHVRMLEKMAADIQKMADE